MVESAEITPFPHSLAHILAELTRLDMLLRVQVWRARQLPPEADGLPAFYIAEEEVDALLEKAIGQPLWATVPLPEDTAVTIQHTLDQLTAVSQQRQTLAAEQNIRLRLNELAALFGLNQWEMDAILICLAPEVDVSYGRLYAYLQDDITRPHPSLDLLLNLLCPDVTAKIAARAQFAPDAPLIRHHLLELFNETTTAHPFWPNQSLRLDGRITRFLLDGDEVDGRLQPYARYQTSDFGKQGLLEKSDVFTQLHNLLTNQDDLILYFQGNEGTGRRETAVALSHHLHRPLLEINGTQLAAKVDEFPLLARLAVREAQLQTAVLYWSGFDALLADDKTHQRETLLELFAEYKGVTIVAGTAVWEPTSPLPIPFFRLPFALPTADERLACWQESLPDASLDLRELAHKFRLGRTQIRAAAATARNRATWRQSDNPQPTLADLYAACRLHSNQKLAQLAQKIDPHYTWADIVLPPERLAQLRELCDQVTHRARVYDEWGFGRKLALGKGLHVLFTGPPGTGKTMAADIIAGELGLDLYKIDISTVVSKFIGETEKNLAHIFAEAETSNAILFFDEADALFGKRTEVHDAHDRYANLEISYLLQRMEAYEGVTILATNVRKNMDEAFMRRMHFIIEFPFPDAMQRARIWRQMWPPAAPRSADVDLTFLAERVLLAGGNIRNIALAASFLAAADGGTVTMAHLLHAAQREYQKMGKLVTPEEFKK
jgi:AAA+ superfamily predicted ATPase